MGGGRKFVVSRNSISQSQFLYGLGEIVGKRLKFTCVG